MRFPTLLTCHTGDSSGPTGKQDAWDMSKMLEGYMSAVIVSGHDWSIHSVFIKAHVSPVTIFKGSVLPLNSKYQLSKDKAHPYIPQHPSHRLIHINTCMYLITDLEDYTCSPLLHPSLPALCETINCLLQRRKQACASDLLRMCEWVLCAVHTGGDTVPADFSMDGSS